MSSSSVASNDLATGFHPRANPLLDTLLELLALERKEIVSIFMKGAYRICARVF